MTRRFAILSALLVAGVTAACAQQVLINAGGATFPYPIYSKWFDEYHKKFPNLAINYASIGSGGGIAQVTAGTVDFGASDGPMTDAAIKEFQAKRGSAILHFPTVLGADVPTYNIPGVTASLNFTGDALAGIFLGKITKWNDPEIANANPGVKLPSNNIVVVHRSDNSGTTFIWTDYLSKVNKEWEMKVGRGTGVNWPVGLGGKGNEGVSGSIQQTANSVGYVELAYAIQNKMTYGKVKNAAGEFIQANLASVTAAAAGMKEMPEDFRVSITNAPGKGVYPMASFTWMLFYESPKDKAQGKVMVEFMKWALTDGQKFATDLGYAPLPAEIVKLELAALATIKVS